MSISRISVIGAGAMGRGIVEVAAVNGLDVSVFEIDEQQVVAAAERIEKSIAKGIKRGKLDVEDPATVLAKIDWHTELQSAVSGSQFVIEAVSEQESLKIDIFQQLDAASSADVILASNTSSVSITTLAAATGRPDKVVGMHFFNPVPIMQPVEIVKGLQTSQSTLDATQSLSERMGKQPFTVADSPGFAVNRILMPLINEAIFALHEGVADAPSIDALMKLGCNHPMGPLELADFVGLDVCLSILRILHEELGDPKFRPCPLLVRTVNAGRLGRKTGAGFYEY